MPSLFGHGLASIAIGSGFSKSIKNWKFWFLGIFCAILPDVDVISFSLGIPYSHTFGHRGFTHSFLFAFLIGLFLTVIFYRKNTLSLKGGGYILFFTLCTASHSILDAMTDGGLGVAFFSPFDNSRYFFPWRPIKVSPIGASNFFSEWGKRVLISEFIWIGIPGMILIIFNNLLKKIKSPNTVKIK